MLKDSGPMDVTESIAARYGVKLVHIKPEEFTFGCSLNMGITVATRELVTIACTHVYPTYPDRLEHLLELFADPRVALRVGSRVASRHPVFPSSSHLFIGIPTIRTLPRGTLFATIP
jgi:rhamnosyltransferase